MCGIVGFLGKFSSDSAEVNIRRMTDSLYRGPDDGAYWISGIALGHGDSQCSICQTLANNQWHQRLSGTQSSLMVKSIIIKNYVVN